MSPVKRDKPDGQGVSPDRRLTISKCPVIEMYPFRDKRDRDIPLGTTGEATASRASLRDNKCPNTN